MTASLLLGSDSRLLTQGLAVIRSSLGIRTLLLEVEGGTPSKHRVQMCLHVDTNTQY